MALNPRLTTLVARRQTPGVTPDTSASRPPYWQIAGYVAAGAFGQFYGPQLDHPAVSSG